MIENKELKTHRILLLLTCILYPLFGWINLLFLKIEDKNIFIQRLIFVALIIISILSSFFSKKVASHFYKVISFFIYLGNSHLIYLGFKIGFSFEHTIGVLLVLIGTSMVFKRIRHLQYFLLYDFLISIFASLNAPNNDLNALILIPVFFTINLAIYIILLYRNEQEKTIQKQYANLNSLIDNTKDIIWSFDKDYKYIAFNKSYAELAFKLTGVPPQVNEKIVLLESLDLPEFKNVKEAYQKAFKGISSQFEQCTNSEGQEIYFLLSYAPIKLLNGKIIGISCYGHDVTEVKERTVLLEELKSKADTLNDFQKAVLDSTEQAIISTDLDGIITQFNKAAENMLGYTASELINKQNPGLFHDGNEVVKYAEKLTKELGFKVEPGFRAFVEKAEKEGIDRNEWTYIRKNGERITVDLTVTTIRSVDGAIHGYTGVASDITKAKSDFREITLLKNALDETTIVSIADEVGTILNVNENFCKITKYSREELIGKNYRILNSGEHPAELWKEMRNVISSGKIWKGEIKNINKDGESYWLDSTTIPVLDENGKPIQYISFRHDITQRKKFESDLIKAKELAEHLAKVRDEFMASMSHEIRTPLNGIIGFTKLLLQSENLTLNQLTQLDAIKTSGDILLVIINDILDLAKIEAGKMNLEKIPINLHDIARQTLNAFSVKIAEKQIKMTFEDDLSVPNLLYGDSVRISQVLINLIGNAIKFTGVNGEIKICLSLLSIEENTYNIQLLIKDSGIGIPEDRLDSIFEPFVQTAEDTARKYGGTGLGLSIVKKILDLMGGEIKVKSQIGIGSEFIVNIPFLKVNEYNNENNDSENKDFVKEEKIIKVLLAEDNQINQLLAETIIRKFGYEIDTVENGELAVAKIKDNSYDVVLMDLMMPIMDGYKATENIRKMEESTKQHIPIIALTADVSPTVIKKCKQAGMDRYISKPFDANELQKIIIELVNKYFKK